LIVTGDLTTLDGLLDRDPELIRARSTRTHHSMLLHYIGANGVEGFRQRTPENAVQVAEALPGAGAQRRAAAVPRSTLFRSAAADSARRRAFSKASLA
jgi:hypothetical protein